MKSLTPDELYGLAGIEPTGSVPWGEDVICKDPGVYVISIPDPATVRFLNHPSADTERGRWQSDQEIIYIGRAQVISRRLRQFYKHVYGNLSPHKGGQAILLLDSPKFIRWAAISDFGDAEDRLIKSFQAHAGRMPFGNRVRSARMRINSN